MSALESQLDTLIADLRIGAIDRLGGAADLLEQALADTHPDAADLARIRTRAAEAQQLLAAAAKGVRAARWRLSEIRAMGQDGGRLVTYDGKGRRAESGQPLGMMQRL